MDCTECDACFQVHAAVKLECAECDVCLQVNAAVQVDGTECDVSSPASVARLVASAKAKLGRVDVWINNAGYSGSFQVRPVPWPVCIAQH